MEFMCFVFTRMPGELFEDVPLVEFMYLVFTRMPGGGRGGGVVGGGGDRKPMLGIWF